MRTWLPKLFPHTLLSLTLINGDILTEITWLVLVTIYLKVILALHFLLTLLSGKDREPSRDCSNSVVVTCSVYTHRMSSNKSQLCLGESMQFNILSKINSVL